MSKRTIPEGSEILPPIAKRIIVDEDGAAPDADATQAWAEATNPGMDHRRKPEWVYGPGLRYAQLQCRMRHSPGTCKHCPIVIE